MHGGMSTKSNLQISVRFLDSHRRQKLDGAKFNRFTDSAKRSVVELPAQRQWTCVIHVHVYALTHMDHGKDKRISRKKSAVPE